MRVGSRALDILIALLEHPSKLVTRRELMERVWPDTVVVEANLNVNIAALRRALGDGRDGNRYLVTVPGRGYCFVGSITFSDLDLLDPGVLRPAHDLPMRITRLVARDEVVKQLDWPIAAARVHHHRWTRWNRKELLARRLLPSS